MANAPAHPLREHGVGHGDRGPVWSGQSGPALAAMQAALRLGAAYVPADGAIPAHRAAVMARDCGAKVVCATPEWLPQLAGHLGSSVRRVALAGPAGQAGAVAAPVAEEVAPD